MAGIRPGLRLRAALVMALACLAVVAALGFTLYSASDDLEESLIRQIVAEEIDYLVRRHAEDPAYQPQQGSNLRSYIVRDAAEQGRLPPFLRGLGPGRHEFFVGQDEYHALVREAGGTRYIVAYEVGLHEQREREFRLLVVLAVLAAAAASLALGYWLSGMLVRQVVELADRVGALQPGAPAGSLAQPGQDAEVERLARAFDRYQARIAESIRREQEFASNASHELRTPLTAIRTTCELLLADASLGEKSRVRVERMSEAARGMQQQIEALLLLARAQAPGDVEPVAIAECVNEAVELHRHEIARKGLALELAIEDAAVLELNYPALRMVVGNLLRNAVRYTDRGFVRIGYAARRLTVADSGRGIEAGQLPRVFDRGFRSGEEGGGTGLGLAIVKRICDQCGWGIEVESRPGQGSTFSILFP
jgi:signal transduction histidine kinase